jgi:signal recognition particle subunit SRP54
MFEELTTRFEAIFKRLRGHGKLTESNIKDALKEVRRALLEADVNYKVVKDFIQKVQSEAVGQKVISSITPGQQMTKLVYDQLVELLGLRAQSVRFSSSPPTTWMLVGLQGSGKTTACGKLASHYRKKGKKPLLVAADVQRPAAVEQLKILGKSINIEVHSSKHHPVKICKRALAQAKDEGFDLVIIDTAGRLHIDDALMKELEEIKSEVKPEEVILVADAMTGQDAVNIAVAFENRVGLDGVFLTKMDGDARGGAALSIKAACGKPIKFIGVGEKLNQIELFYPDRMASRILGMGDVVSLVEKAQEALTLEETEKLERKLKKERFTLSDFYQQLQQLKRMGPLDSLLGMMPGLSGQALKGLKVDDQALIKVEAMINSMTPKERENPQIIDGSRRKRIALGSGTTVQDLNRLLKQFGMMQRMFKDINKFNFKKMRMPGGFFPF